jgi:hypothetical protein
MKPIRSPIDMTNQKLGVIGSAAVAMRTFSAGPDPLPRPPTATSTGTRTSNGRRQRSRTSAAALGLPPAAFGVFGSIREKRSRLGDQAGPGFVCVLPLDNRPHPHGHLGRPKEEGAGRQHHQKQAANWCVAIIRRSIAGLRRLISHGIISTNASAQTTATLGPPPGVGTAKWPSARGVDVIRASATTSLHSPTRGGPGRR